MVLGTCIFLGQVPLIRSPFAWEEEDMERKHTLTFVVCDWYGRQAEFGVY